MRSYLATILTPRQEMGRIAAEMLIRRLNGKPIESPYVELPVEYLEGGSI